MKLLKRNMLRNKIMFFLYSCHPNKHEYPDWDMKEFLTTFVLSPSFTSSARWRSRRDQSSACSSTALSSVSGPCLSASAASTICCMLIFLRFLRALSSWVAQDHLFSSGSSSLHTQTEDSISLAEHVWYTFTNYWVYQNLQSAMTSSSSWTTLRSTSFSSLLAFNCSWTCSRFDSCYKHQNMLYLMWFIENKTI